MINKRLLIKNLLAHNDENSFYDKKRKLELGSKEGKAKFLKHICALSNSNPANNSYIVVGVDDRTNTIVGIDFYDDSKLQNLVNAYLGNPPIIQYENIAFEHLPVDRVVGLVTIRPNAGLTSLRKNIWKYYGGTVFMREGSISMPKVFDIEVKDVNSAIVEEIERHARNNIKLTLDGVVDFLNGKGDKIQRDYLVFKEQFVICWAGIPVNVDGQSYYRRVDIELVNEQVKLFYSSLDIVRIQHDEDSFTIQEFVKLGLGDQVKYQPLEVKSFVFEPNGAYKLINKVVFNPPFYDRRTLHHLYNHNLFLINKLVKGNPLTEDELKDLEKLPEVMLICQFNNIGEPIEKMQEAKQYLRQFPKTYKNYKESMRILRKVKYNA